MMLQQLAADHGLKVERRPIPWDEVSSFQEVAACGTAVILTPIQSLARGGESYLSALSSDGNPTTVVPELRDQHNA